MWRKAKGKKPRSTRIETLVGAHTRIEGDLRFRGGLHVDGQVRGNVTAEPDSDSVLTLSEHGAIEGDVDVPYIVLNGSVMGNVHAAQRVELAARARVSGNVHYRLIEMAVGAEVNGNLVHESDTPSREEATVSEGSLQGAEEPTIGQ